MLPHLRTFAVLALALTGAPAAEQIFTTNPDLPTAFHSAWDVPAHAEPGLALEAADDFHALGLVERVRADGQDCQGCGAGQPVEGVRVRFYAWTPSGPGALQKEYALDADDPAFGWTVCCGPGFVEVELPEPFQATGWHFVSVQVAFAAGGHEWSFHRANVGDPIGEPAYHRTDAGAWAPWHALASWPEHDLSFALDGVPGGAPSPQILGVDPDPIARSGRLVVDGLAFGAQQGTSELRVGGAPAHVVRWTDDTIIAYVPEATPLGEVSVQLAIGGAVADAATVQVVPRTADGRVRWRFEVDSDYTGLKPGVAPDGSVYVNDVDGRLYKLSPDGALLWVEDTLRGQIGNGAEGPVVVGASGRAFVVANPLGPKVELVAYEPDGTVAWVFTEPFGIDAAAGPAIGPDGHLYVLFHSPDGPSLGLCSLTQDGALRWNNPGAPLFYQEGATGADLAFGASHLGGPIDQVSLTVDQDLNGLLYAFALADGAQRFAVPRSSVQDYFLQFQGEVAAGADGTILSAEFSLIGGLGWGLQAYDPADGSLRWRYDPGIAAGASPPAVGPDGTIYFSWDLSRVGAVSPDGQGLWTHVDLGGIRSLPSVSPDGATLLVAGGAFGEPGSFEALSAADGSPLWSVELPHEGGDVVPDERAVFSPDGATAYYPTITLADAGPFQSCHLYALRIEGGHVATYGCGANPAGSLTVAAGAPEPGTTLTLGVDNPLGTQAPGALPFVAISLAPAAGFPCGALLPGYGMQSPGTAGELLVHVSGGMPIVIAGSTPWSGPGQPARVDVPLPAGLGGLTLFAQGLLLDAGGAVPFGLTEALQVQIAP